jgi:hypothetical protein
VVPNLPPDSPFGICGMTAVNQSVVYAAGSNLPALPTGMMKTEDGGKTWSARDMRKWTDCLVDVFFATPYRGWVVGGRAPSRKATPLKSDLVPVVLYTEDGGRTWVDQLERTRSDFPVGEWGWKIQFLNKNIGFVALENHDAGAFLTTSDGGRTWIRRPVNDSQRNANLQAVGFANKNHGWVGGWGGSRVLTGASSETFDGGRTWTNANSIGQSINRFRFLPSGVGYAAGATIYKYCAAESPRREKRSRTEGVQFFESCDPVWATQVVQVRVKIPCRASSVTIRIWDVDGPLVRTLVNETAPAPGWRTVTWDRTDHSGVMLPSRPYVWRVTIDDKSESRLMFIHRPEEDAG